MVFPTISPLEGVQAVKAKFSGPWHVSGTRPYAEMVPNPNLESKSGTNPSLHWLALSEIHKPSLVLNPLFFSFRFHLHINLSPHSVLKGRHR